MQSRPARGRTRRDVQAAGTRSEIVEAARRLMVTKGYIGTSIAAIATEAQVSVQTIYNSVGTKADLLSAVLDLMAAGEATRSVPEIMRERAQHAPDAASFIAVLADWFVEVNARTGPIHQVINQAAALDRQAAEIERRRAAQRLRNYSEAAAQLRARHGLRAGQADHEAAAAIFSIGHPQVYRSLVIDLGWSSESYREWLIKTLTGALTQGTAVD
jgi:AcrR family transcriptional regulator